MRLHPLGSASLLLAVLLTGCAAGRTVVPAGIDAGTNPSQGEPVRVEEVRDARDFSAAPPNPNMPSLMNAGEIQQPAITRRAIARKRGGFGNALGDVLLPEGQSVSQLVGDAVARAFRVSGYRVVVPGDADYGRAVPVQVRVDKFWSWFTPGFTSVALEFQGAIHLRGALPAIREGRTVTAEVEERMQAVFESDWQAIVNKGLDELSVAIGAVLRGGGSR
jgi:hypothetical protein